MAAAPSDDAHPLSSRYIGGMDDVASLAAQTAAEALIVLGWPVQPFGEDMESWRIGDLILSDDDLMALAQREGVRSPVEPLQ